ncbi:MULTISPECIES: phosphate ABC transporter substrate-binding protein PstS [Mycolicibacterium]|uniref:phosphate ABC transporter substrate-binding protein PstS n=1 Tax=Mycolicibacterium TaxID=1866885 RepID=UPI00076A7DE8|nr:MULTISPECIES: phosphate ABC transporter substrate-binding protein PstS [Mycolicibacterium]MCT7373121.1 phosphate ABC transporter substrate-binding protein PstS [Mycolicibacterium llatzerense]
MKTNKTRTITHLVAASALALSACATTGPVQPYAQNAKIDCGGKKDLAASGSTAQANAMAHFVKSYQNACPGQTLTYTSNGSGAGVSEFISGKTDFGGSDSPLQGDEYTAAKQRCNGADAWNLPVVFGPLAITFNLSSVNVLTLDAPTIAKIFTGAITRWDDPAITMLNGKMPAEDIRVVYRSDQSGTTDNFQQYLQAASGGAWNRGTGKVFRGGVGQGAPGNEGTSAMVAKTEGTISYNEWSYAINQNMAAADIKTPAGIVHIGDDWIGKTLAGAKVSGQGDNIIVDLSAIYNTTDKGVYPIMLASYELVCSKNPDAEVGKAVKAFLQSTTTVGQTDLTKSGYVPLPPDFQSKVAAAVSNLA